MSVDRFPYRAVGFYSFSVALVIFTAYCVYRDFDLMVITFTCDIASADDFCVGSVDLFGWFVAVVFLMRFLALWSVCYVFIYGIIRCFGLVRGQ